MHDLIGLEYSLYVNIMWIVKLWFTLIFNWVGLHIGL